MNMHEISEKCSYLKGLFDGLAIDTAKAEGKVLAGVLDLLGEMSKALLSLEAEQAELAEYCEELDYDLGDVESYLCEEDEDDEDDDEDDEFFEVTCPACGETVCFSQEEDPAELVCPACGEEFDCTCSGCDCEDCDECEG